MKNRMFLQLFEDGAGAGSDGSQGGNAGTGNGGQGGNAGGNATYSYEQAEEIANARAERAERSALKSYFQQQGMTEDQVNQALKDFKDKQEASKPNTSQLQKERDEAIAERDALKNTGILRDKGVKADDLDYVLFKVNKLVDEKTDFKKAAEKFLKESPRFAGGGHGYRMTTSPGNGEKGAGGSLNSSINDAIRAAARR